MACLRALALPGIVCGLPVAHSLWLASLVPDGTFYSGDSGFRVLQTSQFDLGRFAISSFRQTLG